MTAEQPPAEPEKPAESAEPTRAVERVDTQALANLDMRGGSAYKLVVAWGNLMHQAGLFPDVKSAAAASVKILAGWENGFSTVASMTGVHIMDGKPVMGAGLEAAAVKRSDKYDYRVLSLDDMACEIEFFERKEGQWESIGKSAFSQDDAKVASLDKPTSSGKPSNYVKFPRNMLFARAMSNGVAWFCPDVFTMRVYEPSELRPDLELRDDGSVRHLEAIAVDPPPREPADAARPAAAESEVGDLGRFDNVTDFIRRATGGLRITAQEIFDLAGVERASALPYVDGGLDAVWRKLEARYRKPAEAIPAAEDVKTVGDLLRYAAGHHKITPDRVTAILDVPVVGEIARKYPGREGIARAVALIDAAAVVQEGASDDDASAAADGDEPPPDEPGDLDAGAEGDEPAAD